MALFKNPYQSHEHSLEVLDLLYGYDSYLDNLKTIADMGCGVGLDSQWFATLMTRDDPPEPRNYKVFAVDKDLRKFDTTILEQCPNIVTIEKNFETRCIGTQVDLIWCHDAFQYSRNPLGTLAAFKETINENGMLILSIPQTTWLDHDRLIVENHTGQYFSYNMLNLTYMLAVSGFDCKDAYFYRKLNSPWLYAAVYASQHEPLGVDASWYDLAERELVSDSLIASVEKYGYAKMQDIVVSWLDKNYYVMTN